MIGLIATLTFFPLVGWRIARRRTGEAFLLGAGITGAVLFTSGVMHVPLVVAFGMIVLWAIGSAAWELKHPSSLTSKSDPRPGQSIAAKTLPTILMCIPLIVLTGLAAITPLNDFDGRAFWVLKAKGIHSIPATITRC